MKKVIKALKSVPQAAWLVVLFAAAAVLSALWFSFFADNFPVATAPAGCPIREELRLLRGDSLSGLFEEGVTLKILFGYYDCRPVERGDIVAYAFAGNTEPVIKVVRAVPGDRFRLQAAPGGWHITVNEEILRNAAGEAYLLDADRVRRLALYEKDYQGVIPESAYLLLGNRVRGSLDGSYFGLVDKSDILGKAVIVR